MSARAVITMSPEEYLAGLKKLESETNKSANKMENSFKQYGTSINKAGTAMRYLSSEMGAGAVAFGRAFQVLAGGKIAIAVAAIAGAFTALKKIWDNLTLSSAEYANKLNHVVEAQQKEVDATRKQQTEEDSLLDRLQELAKRENKTNEEHDEAIRLAEILSGKYGKLGVSVDDLTGDYGDLLKAIKKVNDAQNADRLGSLEKLTSAQSKKIEKQFEDMVTPGFWGTIGGWFTFGKSAEQQTADFRSMLPRQQADFVRGKFDAATTKEEQDAWWDLLQLIEKQIDDRDRLNKLKKTGYETDKEELAARKAESDAAAEAQKAEESAWRARVAELDEEARKQEELDKKHGEALQKELEKEQQIVAERKKGAELRRTNDIASLRGMALRATGQDERADIEDAIYAETQAQGVPLDAATKSEIAARVKARRALQSAMQTSTSPELYAPRVNSLIARGGSSAPVKMPKVEELQSRQLDATNKTNQIANRILNQMDGWNRI